MGYQALFAGCHRGFDTQEVKVYKAVDRMGFCGRHRRESENLKVKSGNGLEFFWGAPRLIAGVHVMNFKIVRFTDLIAQCLNAGSVYRLYLPFSMGRVARPRDELPSRCPSSAIRNPWKKGRIPTSALAQINATFLKAVVDDFIVIQIRSSTSGSQE